MSERAKIDPETLMAYADGELDPVSMKRVERAIAGDPDAAEQVARHRQLRAALRREFDPVAAAPVPERLRGAVRPSVVIDLARARAARARPPVARPGRRWALGGAIAASIVFGVFVGTQVLPEGPVTTRGGALMASGPLAYALDQQLAATQGNARLRMLVSFRDRSGAVCRSFSGEALGGIACRQGDGWALRETRAGAGAEGGAYRQAGTADAALMADAQAMMAGDPLDAGGEAAARTRGWR